MADEHATFWATVAPRYDAVVDRQIGPAMRARVRDRLVREGALGRVVELGCGTGYYTAALAAKAEGVVATDLSPGMVAAARRAVAAPNVTFQVEDCARTSFPDAAFDTAFLSLVLHFTDPAATLAEMRRILVPGGRLIVSNLDAGALRGFRRVRAAVRILLEGIRGYRTKPPKGFGRNVVGAAELAALLAAAGFVDVDVETLHDPARPASIPLDYVRAAKPAARVVRRAT